MRTISIKDLLSTDENTVFLRNWQPSYEQDQKGSGPKNVTDFVLALQRAKGFGRPFLILALSLWERADCRRQAG
jgi:hypothetical protein